MAGEFEPFEWTITKDGRVRVGRSHRSVAVLSGAQAARFVRLVESGAPEEDLQQLLARLTGNYKRGNERR